MGKKLTYEFVKKYVESFNYKLLSDKYINCMTKLAVQCPIGHKYNVEYNSFKAGNRCRRCFHSRVGDYYRHSFKHVKNYVESFKYTMLSKSYNKVDTPLKLLCPIGHIYIVSFHSFKAGNRCSICSHKKEGIDNRYSFDYVKSYIEKEGYKLLSNNYERGDKHILIACPREHKFHVRFFHFKHSESRCPLCNVSKAEESIVDFLKLIDVTNIIRHDRIVIKPHEIDIYLPDYKIGIEFNGSYWHSADTLVRNKHITLNQARNYHSMKTNKAKRVGVKLIHIGEKDWKNKRGKVLIRMLELLHCKFDY